MDCGGPATTSREPPHGMSPHILTTHSPTPSHQWGPWAIAPVAREARQNCGVEAEDTLTSAIGYCIIVKHVCSICASSCRDKVKKR